MNFIKYQNFTDETAMYPGAGEGNYTYPILGLCGESGEVAEHAKRIIRDDYGDLTLERRMKILYELGDVLWYVTRTAKEIGFSLEAVAIHNMDKLSKRKADGLIQGEGSSR